MYAIQKTEETTDMSFFEAGTILSKIDEALEKGQHLEVRNHIAEFNRHFNCIPRWQIESLQPLLLVKTLWYLNSRYEGKVHKSTVLEILQIFNKVFSKSMLKDSRAFFEFYQCTIYQLYNHKTLKIRDVTEEYKEESLNFLITLMNAVDSSLLLEIYTADHSLQLAILHHMCMNLLKTDKGPKVRRKAIRCSMVYAQIADEKNVLEDPVLLCDVSKCLSKHLPGMLTTIAIVIAEDDFCGLELLKDCIRAWTRFVCLLVQNYQAADAKTPLSNLQIEYLVSKMQNNRVDEAKNTREKTLDDNLQMCSSLLINLTVHQNPNARLELAKCLSFLVRKCFLTIPKTISKLIEILIILSADSFPEVANTAGKLLEEISGDLQNGNSEEIQIILAQLQQDFSNNLGLIEIVFNGVDSKKQMITLNLIIGYLKLFGEGKLKNLLFTQSILHPLMQSLITIACLEQTKVTLLEETSIDDWSSLETTTETPWKSFRFREVALKRKLEELCYQLVKPVASDIVLDYLIHEFVQNEENRKEITVLLNEIVSVPSKLMLLNRVQEIVYMYLDKEYWELPLVTNEEHCLKDVQSNVVQICLQLEGIGKIALATKRTFRDFLLKVMYPVLEKAGSSHPLLKSAGLQCLSNMAKGCEYSSVTDLINGNSDYFSHNVINKLRRQGENEKVLNVLSIVVKYGSVNVLPSLSDIIEGALVQSLDKYQAQNASAYLRVFEVFLMSMLKWYKVEVKPDPIRTKEEIEEERELKYREALKDLENDFSDKYSDSGKSAREIYEEDLRNGVFDHQEEEQSTDEYKKPEVPTHIKLVVAVLQRSLNFLPSKEITERLLVLQILKSGVQILKDEENELLPIVHKIWSPLVNRFKEFENPLVINFSFQLLCTLALLSKEFIRRRTLKDVVPSLVKVMQGTSKKSFLKDKGNAYRYTQSYKMQLEMLNGLDRLVYDLDFDFEPISQLSQVVYLYLNDLQPKPLQELSLKFFKSVAYFNKDVGKRIIEGLLSEECDSHWSKNVSVLTKIV